MVTINQTTCTFDNSAIVYCKTFMKNIFTSYEGWEELVKDSVNREQLFIGELHYLTGYEDPN